MNTQISFESYPNFSCTASTVKSWKAKEEPIERAYLKD